MVSVAVVAPLMFPPLTRFVLPFRHWYCSGGVPVAPTLNDADPPSHADCDVGWEKMAGLVQAA